MASFNRINPEQAAALCQQGAQLVDIRDPHSFAQGHMPGAVRLDNSNLADWVANAEQATAVIVCCYHGNSSQPAADYLAGLGFAEVYSLDGGFELWQQSYPDQVSQSAE
ncbi:thiosulfate sulfurtransferase GlpE [Halopseudomonas salegens]|uniref:Thiosulfate sulfurtransferase GlpE n=1 Tax=Halopseudomonas salegens TaxID=1434072 RepID=A0A1H2DX25_9GAMM|nr:thiosulfate sulfurtransferase GlpE [Halopseudomonas salegens]SDT87392.1 thiosulfate sulfurtransferase [Halopseudomonas salegens]